MPKNIHKSTGDNITRMFLHFFLFPFSFFLLFSCTTQKQINYLQGIDKAGQNNFYPYSRPEYRLQKQDILYVSITTLNEEVNNMLTSGTVGSQQMGSMQSGGGYLMGYTIRDSGFISLPVIGDVYVLEKTMEEIIKLIEEKTALLLKDAKVTVKLLSYNITFLGEVGGPGRYNIYGNQLTLLDGLALAGDLTFLANRSRILVLRPTKEGVKSFRINLRDKNLVLSEGYFLLPNDIVIVEARSVKFIKISASDIAFYYSMAISTFTLILLILSLSKY